MSTDTSPPLANAGVTYDVVTEWANTLTHGIALLLSVGGSAILLTSAWQRGDNWYLAGCLVYTACLTAVFAASTLSHWIQEPGLRRIARIWDQGLIYLLIAGTYTPFGLTYLRSNWWNGLLCLMWAAAIVGFLSKIVWRHRIDGVSVPSCVALGWLPALAAWPISGVMPWEGMALVAAGGLLYTAGTFFLARDQQIRYYHVIWHLMVMAAGICHYLAILNYAGK